MEAEGNSGFPAQAIVLGTRVGVDRRQSCRATVIEWRAYANMFELAWQT